MENRVCKCFEKDEVPDRMYLHNQPSQQSTQGSSCSESKAANSQADLEVGDEWMRWVTMTPQSVDASDTEELLLKQAPNNRTYKGLEYENQGMWKKPFFFVQMADTQFGMLGGGTRGLGEEEAMCNVAVDHINQLKPAFAIVCGDMTNSYPENSSTPLNLQHAEKDAFKRVFSRVDESIPLLCVCGNHDIGDRPNSKTLNIYKKRWGDDYYSFWFGGVKFLVINTQVYKALEKEPYAEDLLRMRKAQDAWLEKELKATEEENPAHLVILSHIPPYVEAPDEEDGYFNLESTTRQELVTMCKAKGASKWLCGHYHRNSCACDADGKFEVVVTGAVGCNFKTRPGSNRKARVGLAGEGQMFFTPEMSGFRIVKIKQDSIDHQFYCLSDMPANVDASAPRWKESSDSVSNKVLWTSHARPLNCSDLDSSPSKTIRAECTPHDETAGSFSQSGLAPLAQNVDFVAAEADRGENVTLKITAGQTQASEDLASEDLVNVLVSVEPPDSPENGKLGACDLTCVIDVSGSMGTEATIQDAGGKTERHGLSLLDIAKHGVRTVINSLRATDRLSIISFHSQATTVLPLTNMDSKGQELAQEKLDTLCASGGTDIWKGLLHGLDALREDPQQGRLGHILLLTDGESSKRETILPNLQQYMTEKGRFPGTLNTFGFGYQLDSRLLVDLATIGSGSYSFIPDAGFVGTVFVNTLSNLLVTMAHEVFLDLQPSLHSAAEIVVTDDCISGGLPITKKDGCITVNLGTLQYGQSRDIIVPMKIGEAIAPKLMANLHFVPAFTDWKVHLSHQSPVMVTSADTEDGSLELIERHRCRSLFAEAVSQIYTQRLQSESGRLVLQNAIEEVGNSPSRNIEMVHAILEDMRGQCYEALSRADWFAKWGVHYLPSIMFAHRLQQCNNFKDPGVQFYGGKLFEKIRDDADDVFCELPPPKPSIAQRSAPVSMASYNNCYGG